MYFYNFTLGVFPGASREAEMIPSVPEAVHTAVGKSN